MPCVPEISEATVKILSATGGFLGGTSMMLYMRPSDAMDGLRRIAISVLAAVMLSALVARELFDSVGSEIVMGTAFGIGFMAWSILGAVAKFFQGRQNDDIVQMMKSVNEVRNPAPQPFYPYSVAPQSHNVDNPDA